MMQVVHQMKDLKGKKVLMRADFDVAINPDRTIGEPFRARQQKETIDYLLQRGARVVFVAHSGAAPSLAGIAQQLSAIIDQPLPLLSSLEEKDTFLAGVERTALLENIRQWPGEELNDDAFANQLAQGFDLYVNNAFAVCHRNHASVAAITKHLPSYAGLRVEKEVTELANAISAPAAGKVILISGAKGETKVPVIKHLLNKAETIIVGGAIAHDILRLRGQDIGASIADSHADQLLAGLDTHDSRLVVPVDFMESDKRFLDIGEKSVALFAQKFEKAKLIVWNGPFGEYEKPQYSTGTVALARAVIASGAKTIIGGGDTIAALDKAGLLDKFGFISTGGGAMLMFLAGQPLPGLQALGYSS